MSRDAHISALLMVKDEEKRIRVTLNSIVGNVDSLVVFDTGSTDDTVKIIRGFAKENKIPLHLKEGVFTNFADSRNIALDFADSFKEIDFLLLMDSNDELRGGNELREFSQKEFREQSKEIAYFVNQHIQYKIHETTFYNIRFLRRGCGLRYFGSIHEALSGINQNMPKIVGVELYQDREHDLSKTLSRVTRDINLLQNDFEKDPNNPRTVYYLAQSYNCAGDKENAKKYYKLRAKINKGFFEEQFVSALNLGIMCDRWQEKLKWSMKAFEIDNRAEALIEPIQYYTSKGLWSLAFHFSELSCELDYPKYAFFYVSKKAYYYSRWYYLALNTLNYACAKNDPIRLKNGYEATNRAVEYATTHHLDKTEILKLQSRYKLIL